MQPCGVYRWLEAWRDLRELQGAGAFALLTREAMLAELCRALLRGGHFSLAQSYLQVNVPPRKGVLRQEIAGTMCMDIVLRTQMQPYVCASRVSVPPHLLCNLSSETLAIYYTYSALREHCTALLSCAAERGHSAP